jgi:hypothetical protein
MGHVATLVPSRIGRRVWNYGTRGDTGALAHREMGLVPQDT